MALVQHWKCQDNAASTTVVATVGTNGALEGGDNTSAKATTGPGTALTSAFDLNGTDDAVNISGASINFAGSTAFSFACWVKFDAATGFLFGRTGANSSSIRKSDDTTIIAQLSVASSTFTVSSMGTGTWRHVLITRTAGNSLRCFLDGVESSTGALSNAGSFLPDYFGRRNATFHDGAICDCRVYDSDESANVATIMAEKDTAASGKSYYNSLMQQLVS